ncbi:MAG TPA: hypothetical protein VIS96_19200 [Terrimicrobiaceae bacterium]
MAARSSTETAVKIPRPLQALPEDPVDRDDRQCHDHHGSSENIEFARAGSPAYKIAETECVVSLSTLLNAFGYKRIKSAKSERRR